MLTILITGYALIGIGYILGSYEAFANIGASHSTLVNVVGLTVSFLTWPVLFLKTLALYNNNKKDYKKIATEMFQTYERIVAVGGNPSQVFAQFATKYHLNNFDKEQIAKILQPMVEEKLRTLAEQMGEDEKHASNA